MVKPYGILDDFGWESVALVQFWLSHELNTGRLGVNLSVPSNGIWSINADGSGQPEKLSQTFQAFAMSFSSAAESLLVVNGAFDNNSISTLQRVDDTWVSSPLLSAPYTLDGATVSPNGRWLAFTSRETGRDEIYIRPFADIDNGKWQVSIQGGREPEWSTSGDELFYLQPDGDNSSATLMAVAIANPNGNSPIPDSPQALLGKIIFEIDIPGSYVPSNDGSRFIVRSETNNGATRVNMGNGIINVVENWFDELKRLAPPDLQ